MTDFTARDEASLIALADARATELLPEWTARHSDDLNWATLMTIARLLSVSNFYIDLAFNESFPTAQLYSSLLRQAKQRNMPVKRRSGATATLSCTRENAGTTHTILRGTKFPSPKGSFVLLEDTIINAGTTNINLTARYGSYIEGSLGISNGLPMQTYILQDTNIQKDTLKVFVDGEEWEEEIDGLPMRDNENVYKVWLEPDLTLRVDFGDDTFGNIPVNGKEITYSYLTLGSELGRLPAGNITSSSDSGIDTVVQLGPTVGGDHDESIESLQKALEDWGSVQNRIVTPKDAVFLARRYPGVIDAKIRTSGMLYELYIVTANGNPTPELRQAVLDYLNKRKIDIIELRVLPLIDRQIVIKLNVEVDKKFRQSLVVNSIKQTIMANINDSRNAGKNVYIFDIYRYLAPLSTSGIYKANLLALYKSGLQETLNDIVMSDEEKAVISEVNIQVSATGGL